MFFIVMMIYCLNHHHLGMLFVKREAHFAHLVWCHHTYWLMPHKKTGKWRWAYNDSCHNQDGLFALFTRGSWEIRRDDTSFLPSSPLFLYNYVARKNIRKEKGKRDICEKISLKSSTFRMKLIWWSLLLNKNDEIEIKMIPLSSLFTSFLAQLRRKEKHKGRKTKAYMKRSLSIPININDDIEVMISALQHIGLDSCEDTFTLHPFSFSIASQAKTCRKKGTSVKFCLSASQEK